MAFVTAARRYSYTDPDCLILAASLLPASGDTSPQLMFVCRCSVTYSCPTLCDPCTAAYQVSLSFTISWSLLKLMSVESVMPSNHLILCHLLHLLPTIFPSIRVFSNESALCIRWPEYWSFNFSTNPSNEYSGLISFRIDWFNLHAVQGSLLQCQSSKASILWHSALFMGQLSHPYMTTGRIIALTIQTFVGKVMSLLFICYICHSFLPRSKCLNFMAAVTICSDYRAREIKSVTVSVVSPSICREVMFTACCYILSIMLFRSLHLFPGTL